MPPKITDVALMTDDLEGAITFYRDRLGYKLSTLMPGFADFVSENIILALWDGEHVREQTGVPARCHQSGAEPGVMVAIELASPDEIDARYDELVARGAEVYGPPKNYPWNARCFYLPGKCGEFWEFFAWLEGGKPGFENAAQHTAEHSKGTSA